MSLQPSTTQILVQPNPGARYCVAKVNSLGCKATIGFFGTPKAGPLSGYVTSGSIVCNGKPGLLLYSVNGQHNAPFSGGTLCVATPLKRTTPLNSGRNPAPANNCSGVYQIDVSAFAARLLGGTSLAALSNPGQVVNAQSWGRDQRLPAPNNATMTSGLQFTICQ